MSETRTMRMNAYYYGFTPTGVIEIDRILSAVAHAGKAFHHTDSWCDLECGPREGLTGDSPVEWIQNAANDAAMLRQAATDAEALAAKDKEIDQCRYLMGLAAKQHEKDDAEIARLTAKAAGWEDEALRYCQNSEHHQTVLAEALAAKDAEIARLNGDNLCDVCGNAPLSSGAACVCGGTGRMSDAAIGLRRLLLDAEATLTAERQKVRELREKLLKRQDAHTRDINEGDEELEEMRRSCILSIQATLDDMDALSLTGDATEGQG